MYALRFSRITTKTDCVDLHTAAMSEIGDKIEVGVRRGLWLGTLESLANRP